MKGKSNRIIKDSEYSIVLATIKSACEGNVAAQKLIIENHLLERIKLKGQTPSQMVQSLIKETNRKRSVNNKEVKEKIELIKLFTETYELYNIEKRLRKLEKKTK